MSASACGLPARRRISPQEDAAKEIDVARTTLVAIEQGHRRARIGEVQRLAKAYGTSVNAILREEAVHVDLMPRFRKLLTSKDKAESEAAELLASLATAEVELETLLGIKRVRNYPPERPILPGDVRAQAEHDATESSVIHFGRKPGLLPTL